MKLTDAVYVLTKDDEGAVIAGPVQAVEAPEEDDEHDEEIGSQIKPILAKTLAQYRLIHDGHKLKSAHARAFVLMACRKGLQAGRYGEHVKAKWLKKLSGVKDVKLTDAFAAVVVAIAKMLYKRASVCLHKGDGYGMEATYVLLGYIQDW